MHFLLILLSSFHLLIKGQNVIQENPLIKKCHCPSYQVLDQVSGIQSCVNHTELFVQLWDPVVAKENIVKLPDLPYIIEPLNCTEDFSKISEYSWAFISYDGKLNFAPHPATDQYCIENSLVDGKVMQIIQLCTANPVIPRCCGELGSMNSDTGVCNNESISVVSSLLWPDEFKYFDHSIECEFEPMFTPFDLASMQEVYGMVNYYNSIGVNFCLAAQEDEVNTYNIALMLCTGAGGDTNGGINVNETHIPLCCMENEAFDLYGIGRCIPDSNMFSFPENIHYNVDNFSKVPPHMTCDLFALLDFSEDDMFTLGRDGSLSNKMTVIPSNEYCLSMVITDDNTTINAAIACFKSRVESPCQWRYTIIQVCLFISIFFFIITLIVYLGIEELRRKLNGILIINELVAILISQITLIILQLSGAINPVGCVAAGIIEIISTLASFFWLNCMCFDVWSTLSSFLPVCDVTLNKKRLLKYSLYAWGIPFIVGMIALILQLTDSPLSPQFSSDVKCFFTPDDMALQWGYMYGIILLILLINLGFFIHLAIVLVKNQREVKRIFKQQHSGKTLGSGKKDCMDTENFKLYLKLFLVMGLPWLIEVFTSFATGNALCYLWILDTINAMRGLFIFLIFVTKKTTIDMIKKKWIPKEPGQESEFSSSRSRKTSLMSLSNWMPSRKISKASVGRQISKEDAIEEKDETTNDDENL